MDADISRWVVDHLLRSKVSDSIVVKALPALSLSGADPRLKKAVLLRALQCSHSNASITEYALEIMEAIEDIDLKDAVPITDSMRRAYCALAVECTVKYLAACPDDAAGNYLAAMTRIWRGRVGRMESAGLPGGLFSEELARWRDDLEAAVSDARVCERLAGLNSRTHVLNELKVYLNEAWGILGPSFLDSVAVMADGESVRNNPNGGIEVSPNVDGNDDNPIDLDSDNVGDDRSEPDDGGVCFMENASVTGEKQQQEQVEERGETSVHGNQVLGGCHSPAQREKEIQKYNLKHRLKHTVLRSCHNGVKLSHTEEVEPAKSCRTCDSVPSAEVKDPLPDALQTSEVVRSKLAVKGINHNGDGDVPFQPNDANDANPANPRIDQCDDSLDNSPQVAQPRKKKRRWTSLEEDTLREGVKMFGEGSWQAIRGYYINIFENRSGVDLKDKWRNMMR